MRGEANRSAQHEQQGGNHSDWPIDVLHVSFIGECPDGTQTHEHWESWRTLASQLLGYGREDSLRYIPYKMPSSTDDMMAAASIGMPANATMVKLKPWDVRRYRVASPAPSILL